MPGSNGHGSDGEAERIALYLRVSSEEQRDKHTIETQREFLEQYYELYGLEVVETYEDDGVSGTIPLRERPAGRRLLKDAREDKFESLLVYRLDRLGRSLLVIVDAHDLLDALGVSLRSATEPIDTSTPSGRLIFQMLASFSEYERSTIAERSRDGLQRAFKSGKQLGMIPYGYDIADDGAFVAVEDEARIVRKIIANIAVGATLYSEAKRLNDEGEPSPGRKYRGRPREHGPSWSRSTVRGIVCQGAYAGTHTVNAHKGAVERKVPAIVEPALQLKALSRLQENKRYAGGKAGRNYLLRGLVWCERCGTAYAGDTSTSNDRRYHYYSCGRGRAGFDKRVRNHPCPRVRAEWLEELVWADVRRFLKNPGKVLERVREELAEDREEYNLAERHASLTRRLAAKREEKSRYVKLYAQGHISEEELEVYLADLKNQAENMKLLISSVETDLAQKEENKLAAKSAAAWLMTLRKSLSDVEQATEEAFQKRRELTKLLVEQITIGRNSGDGRAKIQITYRFGPPTEEPKSSAYGVPHTKESILRNAETRLENSQEEEVEIAIGEIAKIARLRLQELVDADVPTRLLRKPGDVESSKEEIDDDRDD
jgi:site-specific DNA recombinase